MQLRYRLTSDDLADYLRFHTKQRGTFRKATRTTATSLLLVGLLPCLLVSLRQHDWTPAAIGAGGSLGAVLFYLYAAPARFEESIRRMAAESPNPSVLCEHILEITPRGLVERTPVSETAHVRAGILRVEETPHHVLIYTQVNAAYLIPRASVLESELAEFLSELRTFLAQPKDSPPLLPAR